MKIEIRTLASPVTGRRSLYLLALEGTTLLLILPIWMVSIVPWADYGDHVAYGQIPAFQQHYEIAYKPLPNLAMDLTMS